MTPNVERFESDGLIVVVTTRPNETQITWQGVGDSRDPSQHLGPFLQKLVRAGRDRSVTIDFRALEYVNSATVSPVIQFVKALDGAARAVTLLYDTSVFWQRTQYRCMKAIAGSLNNVEISEIS